MSIKEILQSGFFKNSESRAKNIAGNKNKVLQLIADAVAKLDKLSPLSFKDFTDIFEDLKLFFGMLKAYYKGSYRDIPWKTLIKMLAAIIYFVFVLDLIPDFIPVGGFIDDIALFAWVIKSIRKDLDKFKEWKEKQAIDESKQGREANAGI